MRQRGFTLVELLTVIAILLIMVAVVLGNSRNQSKRIAVEKSAADVVALFRQARQDSLAVKKLGTRYPSYGVYMTSGGTSARIYADCVTDDDNSGGITDADTFRYLESNSSNCTGSSGGSTVSETLTLTAGTKIKQIKTTSVGGSAVTRTNLSVLFIRPEPTIWLSWKPTSGPEYIRPATVEIEVSNMDETEIVTVTMNSAGFFIAR